MNPGDCFQGQKCVAKIMARGINLFGGERGVVCYFKATYFLAGSLCQLQKREEINVLVKELCFFVCMCLSNIIPSNCNRLQTNASRSAFPSVIVFQFSGMWNTGLL